VGCFYLFFPQCTGNADLVKQELREGCERERGAARLAKGNPGCSLKPGPALGGVTGCHPQPLSPLPCPRKLGGCGSQTSRGDTRACHLPPCLQTRRGNKQPNCKNNNNKKREKKNQTSSSRLALPEATPHPSPWS